MATMMQKGEPTLDNNRFPLGKIRLLHKAIREKVARIADAVQKLGPLSPDAHLVDIDRGIEILEEIVLSHCNAEDITLLPALNEKTKWEHVDLEACGTASSTPRAKRPRTSPVGVNIAHSTEDHGAIAKSIDSLKHVLKYACYGLEPDFESTPIALHRSRYGFFGGPRVTREPWQSPLTGLSRKTMLERIKDEARSLTETISTHLDLEERDLFPMWKKYFSPDEQGPLLVRTLLLSTSANWPRTFGYLNTEDLSSLFEDVACYASDEELLEISTRAAPYISNESWRDVCSRVPKLSKCARLAQNPLMEIAYLRLAMCNELRDLVSCCQNLDITRKSQLQSFASRFAFVMETQSFLSDGEQKVLLPMLSAGLEKSPCASLSFTLNAYQRNRDEVLDGASKFNMQMLSLLHKPNLDGLQREMNALIQEFTVLSGKMVAHLEEAENHLHPLMGKHFGTKEQEYIIGRIMASMPEEAMHRRVLWMFSLLTIDHLESLLRCHARRASASEFRRTVLALVSSVQKGTTNGRDWAELCSRLPELRPYEKDADDLLTREKHGPVSEILRVHKAIRVDLNVILLRTKALRVDRSMPNRRTLRSIAARVAFLRRMVDDHSRAEDDILLPRLEERQPGSTIFFKGEHCNERVLFGVVAKALQDLESVTDGTESTRLVWRLRVAARTLRDEMIEHLAKEEAKLWPLVKNLFTREEQSKIVALIFGNMPADRLRELLPWMIRVLSVSERDEMIQHILEVTRSTMFEKWLKTWLPLDDGADVAPSTENGRALSSGPGMQPGSPPRSGVDGAKPKLDYVKQMLQHGRDSIQHVIKQIARDESIDMETRTRLMQDVMLAPFTERREKREAAKNQCRNEKDDLNPTYTLNHRKEKVFGCPHYQRGVKLRADCCDRLYTCRMCHDEAEESHVMDRFATAEVLCMACSTLQPVSEKCVNDACKRVFAKYFCSVCKLYNDDDSRPLYHCHSCNICRVGKGLGEDFFHCMKCNQCMNLEFQTAGHKCVENAMESDCPVCYEYMFTSTARVKTLKCGHAMHESCLKLYLGTNYRCPHCSKSLTDMQPYFRRIDGAVAAQVIPNGYRNKKLEVLCHDCELRSITSFHFIYHKCQQCKGYNTRVIGERAENEVVRVLPATRRNGNDI